MAADAPHMHLHATHYLAIRENIKWPREEERKERQGGAGEGESTLQLLQGRDAQRVKV